MLNEKYGDTFVVQSIERQTAEVAFAKAHYLAQVSSDVYPGQFRARVDTDFNEVADDYPRLYWNDKIKSRAEQAAQVIPEDYDVQWEILYQLSGQTWKNTDSIDDYLEQGNAYIDFMIETNADDAAKTALALRSALKDEKLKYETLWRLGERTVVFGEMQGQTLTDEQIREKFKD